MQLEELVKEMWRDLTDSERERLTALSTMPKPNPPSPNPIEIRDPDNAPRKDMPRYRFRSNRAMSGGGRR
jgi:hypothetical protein